MNPPTAGAWSSGLLGCNGDCGLCTHLLLSSPSLYDVPIAIPERM
jgi:hypothetical protein